ncbi:MAG: hypothetical protein C4344_05205 [Acidimicrobiia bacterium]
MPKDDLNERPVQASRENVRTDRLGQVAEAVEPVVDTDHKPPHQLVGVDVHDTVQGEDRRVQLFLDQLKFRRAPTRAAGRRRPHLWQPLRWTLA